MSHGSVPEEVFPPEDVLPPEVLPPVLPPVESARPVTGMEMVWPLWLRSVTVAVPAPLLISS